MKSFNGSRIALSNHLRSKEAGNSFTASSFPPSLLWVIAASESLSCLNIYQGSCFVSAACSTSFLPAARFNLCHWLDGVNNLLALTLLKALSPQVILTPD